MHDRDAPLRLLGALCVSAVLFLSSVARGDDRVEISLDHWRVGRAKAGAPAPKLAPGAPRLPFAPAQDEVVLAADLDLPAAVSSRALALELERVRWDASVAIDGKPLAAHLAGDVRLALPPLAPGRHEVLVRARDVRAAGVVGRRPSDDDAVEGGWSEPVGEPPRLAGILGSARIVEASGKAPPREAARTVAVAAGRLTLDGAPVPFFVVDAPAGEGAAAGREAVALARAVGATVLATRGERDEAWLDAVESAGVLVLFESELQPPASAYALEDPRLWSALERQVLASVARHRARPGIVAWGLARGLLAEGGAAVPGLRSHLVALAREVRDADPTRLVLLPGDDARGLGIAPAWVTAASARQGEIALLEPAATPRDLATRVRLAGPDRFLDDGAVAAAHARARATSALEARARGALGIDLGAAPADAEARRDLARALEPLALALDRAPGGGVRSGEAIRLDATLVSDLARPGDVALAASWTWASGEPLSRDSTALLTSTVHLGAGTVARAPLGLARAPDVTERTEVVLHVSVRAGSGLEARAETRVVVWPAKPPSRDMREAHGGEGWRSVPQERSDDRPARARPLALEGAVLLVDDGGATGEALVEAGVAWREAPSEALALERARVLVVGEGALDAPGSRERVAALVERARHLGAGVLVLRQATALPPGVAPAVEAFEPVGARDLAVAPGALEGLEASDLEGWGEPVLPPPGIARPLRASARVLAASAPPGLDDACGVVACEDAAAEEILCQVPLVARARTIPAARALLAALVRAAAEPVVRPARTFFARVEPEVELALESVALPPRAWSAEAVAHATAPVILLDEAKPQPLSPEDLRALASALDHGATLVVHVGEDGALARLRGLGVAPLALEKTKELPAAKPWGPRELGALELFWPAGPGAVPEMSSRFDVAPRAAKLEGASVLVGPGALLERACGHGRVVYDLLRWREGLALPQAKRALAGLLASLGAETREPPIRLPATAWAGVGRKDATIQFFSNGTATARFLARREGRYRVSLALGGTPADGGWPRARVYCDARFLGELSVDGPGPARYVREVTLPAGSHVLSVAFTNDAFDPPEDRNMFFEGAVLELLPPRIY